MITDIATGFCGAESVETKEVSAWATRERAFSGSGVRAVLKDIRLGRR